MRLHHRRTRWVTAALLLIVAIGGTWFFAPRSRITQANFDRICQGMTSEDVEAILGEPTIYVSIKSVQIVTWSDGPDEIMIRLDAARKASTKWYDQPTYWHRLRWHIKDLAEKIGPH
jgi:hypothetical protein